MAEKTEFLQAIDDAILDADSLEKFINGSDSETVLTRLSAKYPTLQKAIKQLFENGGLPATPFATKALMTASALVDGDYAQVTDDTINNGLYVKTAGAWVKSGYDPLTQAKEYVDNAQIDRSKLAERFSYNSLISAGSLEDQRWPEGSYIVASGLEGRPSEMKYGNAIMNVTSAGLYDEVTLTLIENPSKTFRRIVRFDVGLFQEWHEVGSIPDGGVVRSKLAPQFSYNSLISAGSLEDQRWPEGSYIVASGVEGRPMGGGNAIMKVTPAGLSDEVTFTLMSDPSKSFRRIVRFDVGNFGTWVSTGGDKAVPDGAVTRAKLAPTYSFNSIISEGTLDRVFDEGSYVIGSAVAGRPIGLLGGNALLVVESYGVWSIQRIAHAGDPSYRFMRVVLPSSGTYREWQPEGSKEGGSTNRLLGKNVVFLGDSISASYSVPLFFRRNTGCNVFNFAFGGTRMGEHTDSNYNALSAYNIARAINSGDWSTVLAGASETGNSERAIEASELDWSTVDYIILGFGTNDFGGDRPVGTLGDSTEATFSGAVDVVIREILGAYPRVRLMFWSPIWRKYGTEEGGSDSTPSAYGTYLLDYVDALIEVCKHHKVEVVDMYRTSGIGPLTQSEYLVDGLHPIVAKGSPHLADKLAAAITSRF